MSAYPSVSVYAYFDSDGLRHVADEDDVLMVGAWSASTTYVAANKMVVDYGSTKYIAIVDNTNWSPGTPVTALTPRKWSVFTLIVQGTGTSSSTTLAQAAYDLAVYGTNLGTQAYNLASQAAAIGSAAYELAGSGSNLAWQASLDAATALSTANGAMSIVVQAQSTADAAWALAQIGTNTGTAAYSLAQSAYDLAVVAGGLAGQAWALAQVGTNTGTAAYNLAGEAQNRADAAYLLAQVGTNTGTAAYNLATTGSNLANDAWELAQAALQTAWNGTSGVVTEQGTRSSKDQDLQNQITDLVVDVGSYSYWTSSFTGSIGTLSYSFTGPSYQQTTVNGDFVVTTVNHSTGAEIAIGLISDGTIHKVYYGGSTVTWFGTTPPPQIYDKTVLLALTCMNDSPVTIWGAPSTQV